MSSNIAHANAGCKIDNNYVEGNITPLYRAGKGGTHDGLTVIRRQTSRGNTYVTVECPNGEQWKLSRRWNNRSMRFSCTADCIKVAGLAWDISEAHIGEVAHA